MLLTALFSRYRKFTRRSAAVSSTNTTPCNMPAFASDVGRGRPKFVESGMAGLRHQQHHIGIVRQARRVAEIVCCGRVGNHPLISGAEGFE